MFPENRRQGKVVVLDLERERLLGGVTKAREPGKVQSWGSKEAKPLFAVGCLNVVSRTHLASLFRYTSSCLYIFFVFD
jgi:hypothetical protein